MEWHIILAGVVTGTALHEIMEPINVLQKLLRLDTATKTGKIETPMPKGVDTRAKAYTIGIIAITVLSAIAYLIARAIDPSVDGAIQYAVVVAIVAELILMARIDKYHVEIEKMTQRQGQKK